VESRQQPSAAERTFHVVKYAIVSLTVKSIGARSFVIKDHVLTAHFSLATTKNASVARLWRQIYLATQEMVASKKRSHALRFVVNSSHVATNVSSIAILAIVTAAVQLKGNVDVLIIHSQFPATDSLMTYSAHKFAKRRNHAECIGAS